MVGGFSSKDINLQSDKSQVPQADIAELIAQLMRFLDMKPAEELVTAVDEEQAEYETA